MKKLLLTLIFVLWATQSHAVTYYVAKGADGGSDSNNCTQAQTHTTGKLTLEGVRGCMSSGDRLEIKSGTYTPASGHFPSGSGSPGSGTFTVIAAYSGAAVTIQGAMPAHYSSLTHHIQYEDIVFDNNGSSDETIMVGNGAHTIRIYRSDLTGANRQGLFVAADSGGFVLFSGGSIHDNGTDEQLDHNVYLEGANNTIEYSSVYNPACYNFHLYNGAASTSDNNVIRYNLIYGARQVGGSSTCAQILVSRGANAQVYGNIIKGGIATSALGIQVDYQASAPKIYNNTIYDQLVGMAVSASVSNAVIRNNVLATNSTNFTDSGSGTTKSNNFCTTSGGTTNCSASGASAGFVDAAGGNFSLTSSSALLNAGVAAIATGITRAYNGAAPDIGAVESLAATASVSGSDFTITIENNVTDAMLPATSVTGFSFKRATVANAITAISRAGVNTFTGTLTDAFSGGQACDFSYSQSTGNVRSNNAIGGVTDSDQELFDFTDADCDNLTGGGATLTYATGRFYLLQGATDTAWVPLAAAATGVTLPPGAKINWRFKIANTGDAVNVAPRVRVSYDGGAYVTLTSSFVNAVKMLGNGSQLGTVMTEGSSITQDQLASTHGNVACTYTRTAIASPTLALTTNSESECAVAIEFDTSAVAAKVYNFKVYTDAGDEIGGPMAVTIGSYQAMH